MYCKENDLDMPDAFPCEAFTRYKKTARRVRETPCGTDSPKEFGGASNLIAWRFRACHEDWHAYQKWFAESEVQPSHEANFRWERALFGMFSNGVSCIESMTYSLAALASHPHVLSLPFDAQRQRECNPARLADWLNEYAEASRLKSALLDVTASDEWKLWVKLRNRMTHRSTLPRNICLNEGAATPPAQALDFAKTSSTSAIQMDVPEVEQHLKWLAESLRVLLERGSDLVDLCSPPV